MISTFLILLYFLLCHSSNYQTKPLVEDVLYLVKVPLKSPGPNVLLMLVLAPQKLLLLGLVAVFVVVEMSVRNRGTSV